MNTSFECISHVLPHQHYILVHFTFHYYLLFISKFTSTRRIEFKPLLHYFNYFYFRAIKSGLKQKKNAVTNVIKRRI